MMENNEQATEEIVISEEALKKAEEFIEEEEGAAHKFSGWLAAGLTAIAVVMSLFHLYAAYSIVAAQVPRPGHAGRGRNPLPTGHRDHGAGLWFHPGPRLRHEH